MCETVPSKAAIDRMPARKPHMILRTRCDLVFFNATDDHTPFRNFLGTRFTDAAKQAAGGLVFTWPANIDYVPTFAGIDHIVLDSGMLAGRVKSLKIDGSDHKALLATVQFDV